MHHFNVGFYASRNVCVKDIDSRASMVLQNYQKFLEMTLNMIDIVAVGFKCPLKIHLSTQCPWGSKNILGGFWHLVRSNPSHLAQKISQNHQFWSNRCMTPSMGALCSVPVVAKVYIYISRAVSPF